MDAVTLASISIVVVLLTIDYGFLSLLSERYTSGSHGSLGCKRNKAARPREMDAVLAGSDPFTLIDYCDQEARERGKKGTRGYFKWGRGRAPELVYHFMNL
ncbi:hypothetical protein F5Y16DRAFT_376321 [Xylariaceae sp. FL0255]|nr:hypothetical protein F5Y16DRAFT_376321 [Xylariaceae sp. FL0255]